MNRKLGVISLGCSKNLVDTEMMVGILAKAGYELTEDLSTAQIIIINTCTFIDSGKGRINSDHFAGSQIQKGGSL